MFDCMRTIHLEDVHFGAVGEVPFRVLGHHEDKDVVVELLGVVAGVGRGLPDELDGEALNHVLQIKIQFTFFLRDFIFKKTLFEKLQY